MAVFVFSNGKYLDRLMELHRLNLEIRADLFKRLGVRPQQNGIVTMLVISKDSFAGHDALFTLALACEVVYKKKIDVLKMRVVVLSSVEVASKSPYLERASFIFIPDENLLGVENYPELEEILPFYEK